MTAAGAMIAAAVGSVVRWVRNPLTVQINGLGERVNALELSGKERDVRLRVEEEESRTARFERKSLTEAVSRLAESTRVLQTAVERNREAGMEENGDIRERLARIESKVDDLKTKG